MLINLIICKIGSHSLWPLVACRASRESTSRYTTYVEFSLVTMLHLFEGSSSPCSHLVPARHHISVLACTSFTPCFLCAVRAPLHSHPAGAALDSQPAAEAPFSAGVRPVAGSGPRGDAGGVQAVDVTCGLQGVQQRVGKGGAGCVWHGRAGVAAMGSGVCALRHGVIEDECWMRMWHIAACNLSSRRQCCRQGTPSAHVYYPSNKK